MKRPRFFEFEDLPGFPLLWRDLVTDFLSWFSRLSRPYRGVTEKIERELEKNGARRVVDLCSGGGAPAAMLVRDLEGRSDLRALLTDRFPNIRAFREAAETSRGRIEFKEGCVDARRVPRDLDGIRTMFTSFHHFADDDARRILMDAVRQRQSIGVFEFTEPNLLLWAPLLLCIPAAALLSVLFIRPFRWSRLLWTWVVPVIPLVLLWDGFVSCLRSRTPKELRELVSTISDDTYQWEIGREWRIVPPRMTWMIGSLKG